MSKIITVLAIFFSGVLVFWCFFRGEEVQETAYSTNPDLIQVNKHSATTQTQLPQKQESLSSLTKNVLASDEALSNRVLSKELQPDVQTDLQQEQALIDEGYAILDSLPELPRSAYADAETTARISEINLQIEELDQTLEQYQTTFEQ